MEPVCRVAAGSLAGKSILFRGRVSPSELPAYYRTCDVFCSVPTGSESFGIVLLEAMAAGKPVICTNIDGYREIITDGVHGLLVPPGDTRALADAMTALAVDRERRLTMGAKGQRAAFPFDWYQIAARLSQVYQDLCSRPVFRGTHDTTTSGIIRLP
jgi:phosphatidylinositol alpha-mannosyltransferase